MSLLMQQLTPPVIILRPVAREQTRNAIAFIGEDVCANAIKEISVVADNNCTSTKVEQRSFQRSNCFNLNNND